jgi:hypothetical protein
MHLRGTRRFLVAVALIASPVVAGCGGASVVDDAARGAARAGDNAPIPGASGSDLPPVGRVGDDVSPIGGTADDVSRAEAESTEARAMLETMIQGDERVWVCLGLDVVEASGDGEFTIEEYAGILTDHGFGYLPAYRVQQAFNASAQLLEGDLTQLQEIACV